MVRVSRPGAVRKKSRGKAVGSGGQGRQALEGRGPTPKAEDRPYHPKGKAKARKERFLASQEASRPKTVVKPVSSAGSRSSLKETDIVTGRNSVLEALSVKISADTLYIATKVEMDQRLRAIINLCVRRGIPVLEVTRPEIDRMCDADTVHQGVVLKVLPYEYIHPLDMLEKSVEITSNPIFVALDGITDPRNLGAIIRSTAAFGGSGVIIPQRRSASVTPAVWKTSAGAVGRVPVSLATNLTQTLKEYKKQGFFVLGLDAQGDISVTNLALATSPLVIVIGSEGKGLSKLVTDTCDAIVSIPISGATESLNAGIAASVVLYEISKVRSSDNLSL